MRIYPYFKISVICIILTLLATASNADLRSDANAKLLALKQQGISKLLPEELKSMDASIATADMYFNLNDTKNADKYYRAALQKADAIDARLASIKKQPASGTPHPPQSLTEKSTVHKPAEQQESSPHHSHPEDSKNEASKASSSAAQAPLQSQNTSPSLQNEDIGTDELHDISSDRLIGSIGTYIVGKKETLRLVAAKLGVSRTQLAAMNNLSLQSKLKEGQELKYNNRRIIPDQSVKDGIIINIPDRMLYYFQKGKLVYTTAVALGTPGRTGKYVWHTPTGKFRIVSRDKDPTWTVPPSIQEEMKLEGKEVIKSVPPGPGNPLGKYAMKTSLPGILIHSTSKPWSIYTYASHGCIRVYPQWMEELFKIVKVNTPGEIIYKPVKAVLTEEGKILLEVHPDIYSKTGGIEKETKSILEGMKLSDRVDWKKVKRVISRKSGIAEDVTLETVEAQKEKNQLKAQSPS